MALFKSTAVFFIAAIAIDIVTCFLMVCFYFQLTPFSYTDFNI